MEEDILVTSTMNEAEEEIENILRPKSMEGYIGQEKIKENLAISIAAAKMRGDSLDHVLLYGPPGLGKTTLAHIIGNEMGVQVKTTSGPVIEKAGDLSAILTNLNEHDVLFIDEIHRLNHSVEEMLYPAMEDYQIDFLMGKGPSARIMQIPIPKITIIGATTKAGMLSSPLRDRFGILCRLETYSVGELQKIVLGSAEKLSLKIEPEAALEIAKRSRGTPRIANRLIKRVRDYSVVKGHETLTKEDAKRTLSMLEIDELGLDAVDLKLLNAMADKLNGGPCGLDTISAIINEDSNTIEDVYEPYLMQLGFVARTPRGRILLKRGYDHIGKIMPSDNNEKIESCIKNNENI